MRVGNLDYAIRGDTVDLGLFARQPLLWMGNPALVAFLPCKEGWDVPHSRIDATALLVASDVGYAKSGVPETRRELKDLHLVLSRALFGRGATHWTRSGSRRSRSAVSSSRCPG